MRGLCLLAMALLLEADEVSTDEDEREEEEYLQQSARFGQLIQRALRTIPIPDLDGPNTEDNAGYLGAGVATGQAARGSGAAGDNRGGYSNGGRPPPPSAGGPAIGCMPAAAAPLSSSSSSSAPAASASRLPPSPASAAVGRRVFLRGFAPSVTPNDVLACLSIFGPIARFRLLCDPSSGNSLRCASVVFGDAADAARALEAAAQSHLYLANVWAPEASLQADPDGQLAVRSYQHAVPGPFPALLEVPRSQQPPRPPPPGGYGAGAAAIGAIGAIGAGAVGSAATFAPRPPPLPVPPPPGGLPPAAWGAQPAPPPPPPQPPPPPPLPPMQLCVSGLPNVSGLVALVRVNLSQFGQLQSLAGEKTAKGRDHAHTQRRERNRTAPQAAASHPQPQP